MINLGFLAKAALIAGALGLGLASTWYFKMKDDNSLEECSEEVIKQQTGYDIDLTPLSSEK